MSVEMWPAILGIAVILPPVFLYNRLKRILGVFLLLFSFAAVAAERVIAFHSDIRIGASGVLTVTETIEVQAEGKEIRRGILRDFPTEYRDRLGDSVTVPFQVDKVTRNGKREPFAIEHLANGTRIRIGDAGRMLPQGKHVYVITYRTSRQIGFFEQHDELYWNVTGTGWTLPFERVTAEVSFAQRVPAGDIKVEAYTGPLGEKGRDYNAFVRHGSAAFRATRALKSGEGMTIVVAFPRGIVEQPGRAERASTWANENPVAVVGAAGFLILAAYLLFVWQLVGRDPKARRRFPRYEPPAGLGRAGVRYLDRMAYDDRCFAVALLGLGANGYLKIRQEGERYAIERSAKALDGDDMAQRLARGLFHTEQERFAFGKEYSATLEVVRDAFREALKQHFAGRLLSRNTGAQLIGWVIAGATLLALYALDAPIAVLAAAAVPMVALLMLFYFLLPAYSIQGRKLQDAVEGLRRYLSVAEKDDLARMKAPPQTPQEFARFLPYAVALGVEKTWSERFTALLGAEAVAAAVNEYYESSTGVTDSIAEMDSTIAAASTPPGSRSGSSDSGAGSGGG